MRGAYKERAKDFFRQAAVLTPYPFKGGIRFGLVPGVRTLGTGDKCQGETVAGAALIHKPWTAKRHLPHRLVGEVPPAFLREETHPLPGAAAARLSEGRVWGREGAVFDKDGYLIAEPARQIGGNPFDWRERYSLIRPRPRRLSGRWGVLTGCGCHGFFHWMMDVLPRIALIREIAPTMDGWLVGAWAQPFVRESLTLAGIPSQTCVEVLPGGHYQADEIVVASCPSVPGNPPLWAVEYLRTLEKNLPPAPANLPSRFLVSRRNSKVRTVENETELMARLKPLGYESMQLESLPLSTQIHLFRQAKSIIAPHGAGLSLLSFTRPGTRVLEIFGGDYVNVCFWALADLVKANYTYMISDDVSPAVANSNSGCMRLSSHRIGELAKWAKQATAEEVSYQT